jgi:formamidopyrimidine-DNA glycosylase
MPELPEVETVRCQLQGALLGTVFRSVDRTEPAMLRDCSESQFVAMLPGREIEAIDRLGKFLVMRTSGEAYLTLHLGMTGQLLLDAVDESAHSRFQFRLETREGRQSRLEFRDMRKFGRLHLTEGSPARRLALLGPDAWKGEWDARYLGQRLGKRTAPLKAFLLDQRNLAGIGNIYADEILWWTGLSPLRPSGSLSGFEIGRLAEEIPRRLGEGVKFLGCSLSDYVDTQGKEGGFQNWLRAYGRQGQVCGRCGSTILRAVVGGRGTAYCPHCQN